jgi:four helix bundle protein
MASTYHELLVYQKALAAADEISAILKRPTFVKDRVLADQLRKSSVRIVSDIPEGFEQKTDRHFAKYLYDAKGGCSEIRSQLTLAERSRHISEDEHKRLSESYSEVSRMLAGLIGHLEQSDWKHRRKQSATDD